MDEHVFLERVREHVPFALRGGAAAWRAVAHWREGDVERICAGHGSDRVPVQIALGVTPTFHGAAELRSDVELELRAFVRLFFAPSEGAAAPAAKRQRRTGAASPLRDVHEMERRTGARASGYVCQHPVHVYSGGGAALALGGAATSAPLRGLFEHVDVPPYLAMCCARDERTGAAAPLELQQVNLWAGPVRLSRGGGGGDAAALDAAPDTATTSLHYDEAHNVLCVVRGAKRVKLWPPSATPGLAPRPIHRARNHHQSRLGTCADVAPLELELGAGDVAFIPKGWWHQVESHSGTVAFNFWFQHVAVEAPLCAPNVSSYYLRALMAAHVDRERALLIAAAGARPAVARAAAALARAPTDEGGLALLIQAVRSDDDCDGACAALLRGMPRARQARLLPRLARASPAAWEALITRLDGTTAAWLSARWSEGVTEEEAKGEAEEGGGAANALRAAAAAHPAFDVRSVLATATRRFGEHAFERVARRTLGTPVRVLSDAAEEEAEEE